MAVARFIGAVGVNVGVNRLQPRHTRERPRVVEGNEAGALRAVAIASGASANHADQSTKRILAVIGTSVVPEARSAEVVDGLIPKPLSVSGRDDAKAGDGALLAVELVAPGLGVDVARARRNVDVLPLPVF